MERGVTWYNLRSNQDMGLNGIVAAGTLRDSLQLLRVVLEQETDAEPTEIVSIPSPEGRGFLKGKPHAYQTAG
jgi:TnpA family transposase